MNLIFLLLSLSLSPCSATGWAGKLDLSPEVYPVWIRELHDGNHLAGIAKPRIWALQKDGRDILELGAFQAWRSDHGDASVGMSLGFSLGSFGQKVGNVSEALELPRMIKWASLLINGVHAQVYGGYRPVHGADVHDWIYGFGLTLNKPFGMADLASGL